MAVISHTLFIPEVPLANSGFPVFNYIAIESAICNEYSIVAHAFFKAQSYCAALDIGF